jgi:hypothetical protein
VLQGNFLELGEQRVKLFARGDVAALRISRQAAHAFDQFESFLPRKSFDDVTE